MSGLTKKTVYADKVLATLLGVKEGAHVSYAELSKGLHRYIREKNLKNTNSYHQTMSVTPASPPGEAFSASTVNPNFKHCRDCGFEIPPEAVYCDLCGVRQ
jgi:ribosomal protein L40E